jgi:hypothetical protein
VFYDFPPFLMDSVDHSLEPGKNESFKH